MQPMFQYLIENLILRIYPSLPQLIEIDISLILRIYPAPPEASPKSRKLLFRLAGSNGFD